jgi:O-antigen/teichoic acid export membrane protein
MLYGAYVGILHFGFIDGILVRWAGKELVEVGNEIKTAFRFLLLEQIIIIALLALLFYFLFNPLFKWMALAILVYALIFNLTAFFRFTAQAVKKFKLLAAVNLSRGAAFLLLILLIFALGFPDYPRVIFALLTAYLIPLFILTFFFRSHLFQGEKSSFSSLWNYGKENINIGIFVLMGNFALVLFLTIDRLMVSSFFPIKQFAIYAFAVTMNMVVYTFVQAISQVFFPYLSGSAIQLRNRAYLLAKPALILSWAAILTIYFPLTKLIEFYLPHYISSLPVMQVLLCTVGFGSLIQILHVNYFKTYRKQRQYFLFGISTLILAVILNFLAIKFWCTLNSVAIATLISFAVWYMLNELSLKQVSGENNREVWKGLVIICSYLGAFWLASFIADWFIYQTFIYIGLFFLLTKVALGSEAKELINVANGLRNRK